MLSITILTVHCTVYSLPVSYFTLEGNEGCSSTTIK